MDGIMDISLPRGLTRSLAVDLRVKNTCITSETVHTFDYFAHVAHKSYPKGGTPA